MIDRYIVQDGPLTGVSPAKLLGQKFRSAAAFKTGLTSPQPWGRMAVQAHHRPSHEPNSSDRVRQTILATFISLAAVVGQPLTADARKAEPPPPPPTAYDELQKIITGRSGNTGSLLENFKKTVTAPVAGIVDAVQPSVPSVPSASLPKPAGSGPKLAASVPKEASAAVEEVQKGADQAVNTAPELGSSQPLLAAITAAVVGFGGYKIFTGRQGNVASKPSKAVRGAKRQAQRSVGTRQIGTAAKQAPKRAARPLQNAFQSSKAKAKQAPKKAGGLFGVKTPLRKQSPASKGGGLFGSKAPSLEKAAKKVAPTATKKIQKTASKAFGTQKAGTKRSGGTKRDGGTTRLGGTKRIGGNKQPSRRLQLDEDTSSTLGAAGVVGLGLAVAAFVGFNLVASDDSATAQENLRDAVSKIPAAISEVGKGTEGPQEIAATAQNATPDVKVPDVGASTDQAQQKASGVSSAVASVAEKASNSIQASTPSSPIEAAKQAPEPVAKVAEKAVETPALGKPAEVPAPDPLGPKSDVAQASKQVAEAPKQAIESAKPIAEAPKQVAEAPKQAVETAQKEAPQAVAEVAKAAPEALAPKLPQESLEKPSAGVRAPDTSTLRKGAVEDASRKTAAKTVAQDSEQPKPSAAFEAAAKKLTTRQSGADLFETTRAEEQKKFEAAEAKAGQKALGKAVESTKKAPAAAAKATDQAAKAGSSSSSSSNGLILGGLAAAAVVGIAVAAPKDKAGEVASDAASAAKSTAEGAQKQAESAGNSSQGGNAGSSASNVKDDIASRKQEAKKWIADWRDSTGGK